MSCNQIFRLVITSSGRGASFDGGLTASGDIAVGLFSRESEQDNLLIVWQAIRNESGTATTFQRLGEIVEDTGSGVLVPQGGFATNEEYIAIGRRELDYNGSTAGHVQLVRINANGSLTHERTIAPPNAIDGMQFGAHLVFDGNLLYVSAPKASVGQAGTGKVYLLSLIHI